MTKPSFLNFQVDHMTLLLDPRLYPVAYFLFRIVFGVTKADILYEKRKEWKKGQGDVSMTFAARIGAGQTNGNSALNNTIVAVVQPSEPAGQPSHVRDMLEGHSATAHWQHIALRVPDLLEFHRHAQRHGVNFITPILKDADEDLIQVFSGEWFVPGSKPSGMFFEFVQRNPNPALLKKLQEHNRESWFRDQTFLGLYAEKEKEYQSAAVTPFIDQEIFHHLQRLVGAKALWEISENDVEEAAVIMKNYGQKKFKDLIK